MKQIILDGKRMRSRNRTYIYLRRKLGAPGYLGHNLDALWDVLSTCSDPLDLKLINKEALLAALGPYGEALIEVFRDAQAENPQIHFTILD